MNPKNLNSFGITYIGVRTKHIDQMKQFAEQILGYEKTQDDGDFVAFNTPQGQRFELFAEGMPDKQFYPLEGSVAGFEVSDMDTAIAWTKANSLEMFEEGIGEGKNGTRWAHFRGPDGHIYEFVHHPSLLNGGKPE